MSKQWTDYVSGSDFGIYTGENLIACAVDNQMQKTKNMVRVTNKDSGKAEEYRPGRGDGTASGNAKLKYSAGHSYWDLVALMDAGTEVTLKYSNDVTAEKFYEVKAYISELSRQDPDDDNSTMSYTFQFSGEGETKTVPGGSE